MHVSQRNIIKKLYSDFSEAHWLNRENLRQIIEMGRTIPFGKEHRFGKLRSEDAFRNAVPLSDRSDYSIRPFGDFLAFPARYTISAPGRMGQQRILPLTLESLRRYSSYIYDMPYTLAEADWNKHLHTSVFRSCEFGYTRLDDVYFTFLRDDGRLDFLSFAGGRELLFSDDITDIPYVKSWLALATPDLASFQSIYLYEVLLIFRYIEDNWRTVLSDMRRGEISAQLCEGVKERLLALRPEDEWLDFVEGILSEGFDEPVAPKIWKDLQFVSGIGGKEYDFQEKALLRYIGNTPFFYFACISEECIMGVPLYFNKAEYALIPRSAYYEFIPEDGGDPLKLDEIREGEKYEVVITTFSGLYRYRTGYIIKILSFFCQAPIFEICGQRNDYISIVGEKSDAATVASVVCRMWIKSAARFAVGIDERTLPCRYVFFAEGDTGDAELFDSLLRGLFPDYDNARALSKIAPAAIYRVAEGEIAKSRSVSGSGGGYAKSQVIADRKQTEYLLAHGKEL